MTEYLKKIDVMRLASGLSDPWFYGKMERLPTHTFPDPSDAVDGDLISRKALLERLNMPFLKYMQTKANGRRLIYLDEVHEVITEMPLPPAPSVDVPESGNSKLDATLERIAQGIRSIVTLNKNGDSAIAIIAELILTEIARLLAERGG